MSECRWITNAERERNRAACKHRWDLYALYDGGGAIVCDDCGKKNSIEGIKAEERNRIADELEKEVPGVDAFRFAERLRKGEV